MGVGGGENGIHRFHDTMQRRISADRHVRPAKVVIDRAHHPHHVQVGARRALPKIDDNKLL